MTPKEMLKAIRILDDIKAELLIEFYLQDSYLKGMQHHLTAKHNAEKELNPLDIGFKHEKVGDRDIYYKPLPSIAAETVQATNYASNLPAGHTGE